jgi:serine/threonine-protein kinase
VAKDARIGTVVADRYKILERLSEGAMGVVYRAERLQLGRIVAVKFLHTGLAATPEFIKRFELEARMMSRLEHPHCVSVIDFGVADAPFIVMDFVTGTTLRAMLDDGPLQPMRAITIAKQVCAGLAHAHEKGIIHRDVKAANVMLAQATGTGDHVRLLDFGLAKLHDSDQSASSHVVGTPSYMSPEQAAGKKVDGRSDIYATTVLLYELLTGEKPFFHEEMLQLIRMHVETPPPTLHEKSPKVAWSDELEAVIAKGLAMAPDDRYQVPEELADALDAVPEAGFPRAHTGSIVTGTRVATVAHARRASSQGSVTAAEVAEPPAKKKKPKVKRRRGRGGGLLPWIVGLAVLGGGAYAFVELGGSATVTSSKKDPAAAAAATREAEIRRLNDARRRKPNDPDISFALARLYVDKGWRSEAVALYAEAVRLPGKYKSDSRIIKDLIDFLGDDSAAVRANSKAVLKKIGVPALPQLRIAQREHKDPTVRTQAGALVTELQ